MILDKADALPHAATIDDLFRRAGVRHPQAIALIDPPNRETFTDGPPRTLNYAEVDRLVSNFAARLQKLGLHADSVVAIQLPNTTDTIIAILGTLRAGMIVALLPLLWRQHDIVNALRGVGCKAIVTCARAGRHRPVQSAVRAAAELFPIRHVCAFGHELPDGVVALGDFETNPCEAIPAEPRAGIAAAHVAVVTFDVTPQRIVAVPRSHAQLIAGGLVPYLEADLGEDATLLSTIAPSSFAGLASGLMPWLLAGGTLALHHGYEPRIIAEQCAALAEASVVLPGTAVAPMAEAGVFNPSAKSIVALWRAPEQLEACAPWLGQCPLVDVAAFGEIGVVATRRGSDGIPAPLPAGAISSPRRAPGAVSMIETARGRSGTLKLRGPMVPSHTFPAGSEKSDGYAPDAAGFLDTGYLCRGERDGWVVTAPPPGIAAIGGYRIGKAAFEAEVAAVDPRATILAVPDGLLGERLAGAAEDAPAVIAALRAAGANPLISGAFRLRGEADAA